MDKYGVPYEYPTINRNRPPLMTQGRFPDVYTSYEECRYALCPGASNAVPFPRCHACPNYFDTKFRKVYASAEDCQASECFAMEYDGEASLYFYYNLAYLEQTYTADDDNSLPVIQCW